MMGGEGGGGSVDEAQQQRRGGRERHVDKLVIHAQRVTLCESQLLEKLRNNPGGRSRVSFESAFFSSMPLDNLLAIKWLRVLCFLVAILVTALNILGVATSGREGHVPSYAHYRFTNLESRNGTQRPGNPGIARFGLSTLGEGGGVSRIGDNLLCRAKGSDSAAYVVEGGTMILSGMGGGEGGYAAWHFWTLEGEGTQGADAVRFTLEGSDDMATWELVGSSKPIPYFNEMRLTDGAASVPDARGQRVDMDARMDEAHVWLVNAPVALFFVTVLTSLASSFVAFGYVKPLLIGAFGVGGVIRLAGGLYFLVRGVRNESLEVHLGAYLLAMGLDYWLLAHIIRRYEEILEIGILLFLTVQIAVQYHLHKSYFGVPEQLGETTHMPSNLGWSVIFLSIVTVKVRYVLRATQGIEEGKARYDGVWRAVVAEQGPQLEKLADLAAQIKGRVGRHRPRQVKRQEAPRILSRVGSVALQPSWGDADSSLKFAQEALSASSESLQNKSISTSLDIQGKHDDTVDNTVVEEGGGGGMSVADNRRSFSTILPFLPSSSKLSLNSVLPVPLPELETSISTVSENGSDLGGDLLHAGFKYVAHNVLQSERLSRALLSPNGTRGVHERPIRSLDHLHHQATLLHSIFLEFVVKLGMRHNGKFRVAPSADDGNGALGEPEFAAWIGDEKSRPRIKLGGVKSVRRCIEKVDCCYKGDASQLLDLCRESLYFDTVGDLEACLSAIYFDEGVQVVWIKNNMECGERRPGATGDQGAAFAGMRFVKVCVRLVGSTAARILGVETHVCELLLVLTHVARVQTLPMCHTYIEWRRCKRVMLMLQLRLEQVWSVVKTISVRRKASAVHGGGGGGGDVARSGTEATAVAFQGPPSPQRVDGSARRLSSEPPPGQQAVISWMNDCHASDRRQGGGSATTWGLSLSEEMVSILEALSRMSGMCFSDFLDRHRATVEDGFDASSSLGGLWFSAKPVLAAMQRTPMQVFFFAVCVGVGIYALGGCLQMQNMQGYAFGPFLHYRLEALITRDGAEGLAVTEPGVSDFGILGIDRCTPQGFLPRRVRDDPLPDPAFAGPVGASYLVTFRESRSMTGWFLRTGSALDSAGLDPSYYKVWGSNDALDLRNGSCIVAAARDGEGGGDGGAGGNMWCGARWKQVGSPLWLFEEGLPTLYPPWKFSTIPVSLATAREQLETYILAPDPYVYHWYQTIWYLSWCFFTLWSVLAGHLRCKIFLLGPDTAMVASWVSACCCVGVGGLHAAALGLPHMVGIHAIRFACFATMLAACLSRYFVHMLFVYFVLDLATLFVYSMVVENQAAICDPSWIGAFLVWTFLVVLRRRALERARKLTRQDQELYDKLWDTLCRDEESIAGMRHLENVIRTLGIDERTYCAQHNRKQIRSAYSRDRIVKIQHPQDDGRVPPLFRELGLFFLPGRPSRSSKIQSFDQLYAAAAIANVFLQSKIKDWAAQTSGFLPVKEQEPSNTSGRMLLVNWEEVMKTGEMQPELRFVGLKRHKRSFEKMVRSYQYDPSKLLDISRNCIVFDTLGALTKCLGVIVTDQDVRVERVKNRMTPGYNSDQTGGYRDVCLNVRVVNMECTALGAEMHMCEVQLLVKDFAELKTLEGHKHYREARNARGT